MSLEDGLTMKEKCDSKKENVAIDPKTQRKTQNDRVNDSRGGATKK